MNELAENSHVPLVVDLDGTLINSDLLIESFFLLGSSSPLKLFGALSKLASGKAAFKAYIADHVQIDPALLPYNEAVLETVKAARSEGRPVHLVSASDERYVKSVAAHLGLFDQALGTKNGHNLSAHQKAALLTEQFGAGGFDYIGNSKADIEVWKAARTPLVAGVRSGAVARFKKQFRDCGRCREAVWKRQWRSTLRAMRLHQWMKNSLIFVPLFTSHQFTMSAAGSAALAFMAFSLCASSVYVLNDLFDLQNDRGHERKKHRAIASGQLPIMSAAALSVGLLFSSIVLGSLVSLPFLLVMALYYSITLAYSVYLKRIALVDVSTLAILYTIRIFAGGAAISVVISEWLMAFSIFLFLFLAIIKRYVELVDSMKNNTALSGGRGFRPDDMTLLCGLAGAAGYISILVLALYLQDPAIRALYATPTALWGVCLLLLFWVNHMLLTAHRGEMNDDPVAFAATDPISIATGAGVFGFFLFGFLG